MKFFVPIRSAIVLTVLAFMSFTSSAQILNGGTVSIPSVCASPTSPAATISNVSSASGGAGSYSYQWEAKIAYSTWVAVIGGTNETLNPGILFNNTDYRRKVTDVSGNIAYSNTVSFLFTSSFSGGSVSLNGYNSILVNASTPLIISNSPASSGSGSYTYSWEAASSASGPWNTIANETSLTYQPPTFTLTGSYFFRRKAVDNVCGSSAFTSIIEIKVLLAFPFDPRPINSGYSCVFPGFQPTYIIGQPSEGGTAPYTYLWEQKTLTGTWAVINGATGASYQPSFITETTIYRRYSADAAGNSGYSNELEIAYVTSTPNPGSVATNLASLIAPNAPTYSVVNIVSASNFYGGDYIWEISTDNGVTWQTSSIIGSTPSYFPESAPTVNTCYRRAITNTCASAQYRYYSNIVCIPAPDPLTAGSITPSFSGRCIATGTSPGLITGTPATGGATPYTYQWQKNDNGNWVNIASATNVNYTPGTLNYNTNYRRQVTDANSTVLYSNEIAVNLQSLTSLKGGIVDGPIVTCSGTAPGIVNNILDACGGGGSLQYTWEISSNGGSWSDIANTNAPTHNALSITVDTRYRRKVGDGCGNAAYSNEVPVYVYPAIEAGTISPVSQTVCSNTQVPEILSLMQNCHYTNGTVSYQWQKSSSASGPWTNVSSTQSFYQAGLSSAITYYRLKVSSTVCGAVAYSNVATIDVKLCTASSNSGLRIASGMQLYPNPIGQGQTAIVTIDGSNTNAANYKAILRSIDGRAYTCTVTGTTSATNRTQLQVKLPVAMAKGTYLIQISNSQKQWADRILIY